MKECRAEFGADTEIYFIIGTDAFLNLEKWYAAEDLLEGFSFAIGMRPGYREEELKALVDRLRRQFGTKIVGIHNPEVEISSTDIKNRIREGRSIKYLVPERVEDYIYRNGLYT